MTGARSRKNSQLAAPCPQELSCPPLPRGLRTALIRRTHCRCCSPAGAEKLRKEQLEQIVAHGLQEFLKVGAALAELRNRRLYRTEYPSFEAYIKNRFGLHRSAVDGVIRSAQTAQVLLDAGIELPSDTTATVLRPISGLPDDELKTRSGA